MKRKMKISGKKVVSSCLVFAMMCQLVGSNNMMIANAENETDAETKTYIVMADSSKEFNDVTSRAAFSISEEDPELSDNNIAVMELSPEEAEEMQQNDGLIVEEDIIISANSLEEEIITEGTEAETILTESEEESQTTTAETEVTEEAEITEKSTVSTETIESTENLAQEDPEETETEDIEKVKKREFMAKLREARNNASETEVEADWNLQVINVDEVNTNARSIQKVKVALLDSGVDYVDGIVLADSINLVEEEDYVVPMYRDLTGHGTGIASIICANGEGGIKGVNPNVDLYSVKVLDGENKAPLSRIIKGIYWCIDNDVNIINMSFGTSTYSNAMKKAVEDAYDAGILMVGASGNNAGKVEYPAAFKEVMAVAATNPEAEISSFSNTGKELDVAAPGEKIQTASFFGGSVVTHGTSIAVPHVVGVASLLWEKDLSKSHEFIRQLIDATSKNITNFDECGLIDTDYAMRMYETFSENFYNSSIEGGDIIPENTDTPDIFEEICDNEAYVEGRWGGSTHQGVIDDSKKDKDLDSKAIAIMKLGAIYPDKHEANVVGYGNYPEYHGGVKWDKVPDKEVVPVNFVSCYLFLTRIALRGGDTSVFKRVPIGMDARIFNKIKSKITTTKFGDLPWSQILAQYGNTKANRKYFLFGVAIHLVSDSFAHRVWYKNNGVVGKFISHGDKNDPKKPNDADNAKIVPNRIKVTREAVDNILWNVVEPITAGAYWDIAWAFDLFNDTFARQNLYQCFIEIAGSDSNLIEEYCDVKKIKNATHTPK
ncbi:MULTISPECIES: S8 family peptidase [Robinsoniella]|uniref:S8 family peptidase n=1 Tax=Robinsoniella TaxID=588605 RepID=UPI0006946C6C|nr:MULTISPECIES: S8 family peptidase [Robinsoniella]